MTASASLRGRRLRPGVHRVCRRSDHGGIVRRYTAPLEGSVTDEQSLRAIAADAEIGFNTGDVDRIMRHYGPTYVDVNLRVPVQTHAERRVYYARVLERPGLHVRIEPDQIDVRGDLA